MASRTSAPAFKVAIAFAGGLLLAQLLALWTDVYVFRHFEPRWGTDWSFWVLIALALVSAVMGALVFALGRAAVRLPVTLPGLGRPSRCFLAGGLVGLLLVVEAHLSARLLGFASHLTHMVDIGSFVALAICAGALSSGPR